LVRALPSEPLSRLGAGAGPALDGPITLYCSMAAPGPEPEPTRQPTPTRILPRAHRLAPAWSGTTCGQHVRPARKTRKKGSDPAVRQSSGRASAGADQSWYAARGSPRPDHGGSCRIHRFDAAGGRRDPPDRAFLVAFANSPAGPGTATTRPRPRIPGRGESLTQGVAPSLLSRFPGSLR
jgi:hypothetical protein